METAKERELEGGVPSGAPGGKRPSAGTGAPTCLWRHFLHTVTGCPAPWPGHVTVGTRQEAEAADVSPLSPLQTEETEIET